MGRATGPTNPHDGARSWSQGQVSLRQDHVGNPARICRADKRNDEIYKELFFTIQKKGVIETFWRKEFRYWYPGDGYKYLAMTTDNRESKIINRAKVSE